MANPWLGPQADTKLNAAALQLTLFLPLCIKDEYYALVDRTLSYLALLKTAPQFFLLFFTGLPAIH